MKKNIISLLILFSLSVNAQVKKLGFYSNEISYDGHHSVGYMIQLWKYNNNIIGKISYNEGLIGDQESNFISDVQYDSNSKSLSFKSKLGDLSLDFVGKIYKSELSGLFKWSAEKVTKKEKLKVCCNDAEINIDYKSFEDWKKMWNRFEN